MADYILSDLPLSKIHPTYNHGVAGSALDTM